MERPVASSASMLLQPCTSRAPYPTRSPSGPSNASEIPTRRAAAAPPRTQMTNCYTRERTPGGVAELADAPDLKSGGREVVWVRVPPPLLRRSPANKHFLARTKETPSIEPGGLAAMRQH